MVSPEPSRPRAVAMVLLAAALLLLGAGFPYFEATRNANERPRLMQGMALLEAGRLDLDAVAGRGLEPGPDVSRNAAGRLYPNKPPATSVVAGAAYLGARVEAQLRGQQLTLRAYTYWARLLGGVLPAVVLLGLVIRREAPRVGFWPAAAAGLVCLLATPMQVYAHLLYGHALAALFLYVGIELLAEAHAQGAADRALGGGFAAGAAVAVEYGAVFAGLPVAALLVWGLRRPAGARVAIWSTAGALVPVSALAAYQWRVFGSPLRTGYHHVINPEFAAKHGQGLLGLGLPRAEGLWTHVFDPGGGLLWWAPVAVVAVGGLVDLARDREALHRDLALLALGVLGTMVVVGAGLVFDGGWRVGPRYLVCALPMLAPGLARVFGQAATRPGGVALAALLGGYGVTVNALAANLWPHLDLTNVHGPVGEVLLPLLTEGYTPYGPLWRLGIPGASYLLVGGALVLAAFACQRTVARAPGPWPALVPVAFALGVLLVPALARLVPPHPRAADNLAYIRRTFEPRPHGAGEAGAGHSMVIEPPAPPAMETRRRRRGG